MRAPWKRAAILAVATCSLSVFTGCKSDVESNDESIADDLAVATSQLGAGQADKATAMLAKTVTVTPASPMAKVQSNTLLAQAEADAADGLLQKVAKQEATISALLVSLERVGWQIASNNGSIAGFGGLNPTAGQQAFEQVSAAAEKGEGGAWVKGTAPVPSLADVKQRQETLGKQIDELTKQRTDLAAKRALALEQAAKFEKQADATTGSSSVGFYIQKANQRKEADEDEVKMRDLDAQLMPLQQDLAVATVQQQSIEGTLASIQDQVQKLQQGWQGVQKQMDQMKAFSSFLVSGTGSAPGGAAAEGATGGGATTQPVMSLTALATELNEQVKTAGEQRGQAIELLNKAYQNLAAAQTAAAEAVRSVPSPNGPDARKLPERAAWQALIEMNDPAVFKIRQAQVLSELARVYSGQYVALAQRNAVARLLDPALKQTGAESQAVAALGNGGAASAAVREGAEKIEAAIMKDGYAGFTEQAGELDTLGGASPTPSDQEAVAAVRGDFYYVWANNVAAEVAGNPGQGDAAALRGSVGHLVQMTNYYGWSRIAALQGKAPDAQKYLASAVAERKALTDNPAGKGLLPAMLPAELAEVTTTPPAVPGATDATTQAATTEPAASPGTASVDTPDQAAVRALTLAFYDAILSGDQDKARTMVAEDTMDFRMGASLLSAYFNFRKAATDKFGDEAITVAPPIPDPREKIRTAQIQINGDTATFVEPDDKNPDKAKRVGGAWKMDVVPTDRAAADKAMGVAQLVGPIFARTTIAIQNGKYKTVAELRAGIQADMKQSIPGYTPPAASGDATAPAQTMPSTPK